MNSKLCQFIAIFFPLAKNLLSSLLLNKVSKSLKMPYRRVVQICSANSSKTIYVNNHREEQFCEEATFYRTTSRSVRKLNGGSVASWNSQRFVRVSSIRYHGDRQTVSKPTNYPRSRIERTLSARRDTRESCFTVENR